jgi:hypothetical protein
MWYYNRLTGEHIQTANGLYASTTIQPPVLQQNQCALFLNGAWRVVADYRGVQFYRKNGGYSVFLELGDSPGDDLVLVPRPSKSHAWIGNDWQLDAGLVRADLLNKVAAFRRNVEEGGITVGGVAVDTSRTSQAMLTQAYTSLQAGFLQSVDWKGADGWHQLNAAQVAGIAQAVASHVENCFTKEKILSMQIALLDGAPLNNFDIAAAWAAV